MNIIPTIGRIMWFHRSGIEGVCMDAGQPMAAIVACVHNGGRSVTAQVIDHTGHSFSVNSVRVRQDGDPDDSRPYVAWMPYQVGQAKAQAAQADPQGAGMQAVAAMAAGASNG